MPSPRGEGVAADRGGDRMRYRLLESSRTQLGSALPLFPLSVALFELLI